jgi:hypothetical protein
VADVGLVRHVVDGSSESGADRGRRGEHHVVPVAPEKGQARAVFMGRPERAVKLQPPHAEHDQQPATDHRRQRGETLTGLMPAANTSAPVIWANTANRYGTSSQS